MVIGKELETLLLTRINRDIKIHLVGFDKPHTMRLGSFVENYLKCEYQGQTAVVFISQIVMIEFPKV